MKIISRAQWGAKPWRSGYTQRPLSALNRVLIHYHGGPPRNTAGVGVPREIEAIHLANGWSGVGYHFIVSQAGEIFEGRGWDKIGAHCPGHNTDGLGIYIGVGGDQEASPAAKAAARWLYDEACRRTGKNLTKSWHGYDYATACPGPKLIAWVKAGMPTTTSIGSSDTPTPQKDEIDMASLKDLGTTVTNAIRDHWSEEITIPGEPKKRTRNQIFIWGYARAGAAARDAQKALAVSRLAAERAGVAVSEIRAVEAKVDELIDGRES